MFLGDLPCWTSWCREQWFGMKNMVLFCKTNWEKESEFKLTLVRKAKEDVIMTINKIMTKVIHYIIYGKNNQCWWFALKEEWVGTITYITACLPCETRQNNTLLANEQQMSVFMSVPCCFNNQQKAKIDKIVLHQPKNFLIRKGKNQQSKWNEKKYLQFVNLISNWYPKYLKNS